MQRFCDEILTLLQFYYFQTQSCNWRNPKNKSVRKKRDLIDDEEEDASKTFNETLSESVSLFQAIHVLQTDEDELSFQNETNAGTVTLFSSTIFFIPKKVVYLYPFSKFSRAFVWRRRFHLRGFNFVCRSNRFFGLCGLNFKHNRFRTLSQTSKDKGQWSYRWRTN